MSNASTKPPRKTALKIRMLPAVPARLRSASPSAGRKMKETKGCDQQQGDAKAASPGHHLDPGREQLDPGGQRGGDDENHAPTEGTDQPAAEQLGDRPAGWQSHRQDQQSSQGETGDAREFTLLGLGNLELRQPGCLDPKALPRGRALRARDALTARFHSWMAATSAVTNARILACGARQEKTLLEDWCQVGPEQTSHKESPPRTSGRAKKTHARFGG